ncbi:peptidoglycan binding domain-containing protein [Facklamia sp. DSM 111018]|uniref:Peptidoglycan binding domain-containing protein n=1 Tax=Facklamia lactis TaxID=2749967 RepID=A0ABS0LRI5_9LACT|nr:L,D-transpeptidase family protein [Facklamia lactis]MBG9980768.1 peptidoglycan binding domain-containing protein [Facklamia lactis]MBG9986582.1 peptidoglycan binding domain-containing protein [Facklamia lactis]
MKKGIIITVITLVLLGVAYSAGIGFYAEKFQANTTFGDVDISNLTLEEAEKKIEEEVLERKILLKENGKELGEVSIADLGAVIDADEVIENSYLSQNPNKWVTGYFSSTEYNNVLEEHVHLDPVSVQQSLNNLGISNDERTSPTDATITYSEATGYQVEEAEEGTQLDLERVSQTILKAIQDNETTVELNQAYAQPTVTSKDERIEKAMDMIEGITNKEIVLKIEDKEVQIPQEKILEWLYFDPSNNVVFDEVAIDEYLTELNEKHATYTKERKFKSTLQGEVTVQPGTLGWSIDRETEVQNIIADLSGNKDVKRQPAISGTGYNSDSSDDIGSTYIEVDLTNQMMYYYEDGTQLFSAEIVSGMADADPPTPTIPGAYAIWDKQKDATLVGVNQQRGNDYRQPVSYWMPFDDTGQGIHDANWQSSFGGDVYMYAGSQGCINTPPALMSELFEMVEVGTPVIVF